jgi:TatD DNase family protein
MWIDSHCHLDNTRLYQAGPEGVVAAAQAAGVDGMISINCQIRMEFADLLNTVRPLKNVWCSVGTHPHEAGREDEKSVTLEELVHLAKSDPKIVAIGEAGLDYYYEHSSREDQQVCFRKHIQACLETGLPLVVHARDADEDVIRILHEESDGVGGLRGVMHCFSSSAWMAREALDLGFYISFSGILTFKKSEDLREIARNVPADRLLVETDAPYLAPEPHRGEMNQPALVTLTGAKLAELHNKTPEEMARITSENFFRLFDRARLQS